MTRAPVASSTRRVQAADRARRWWRSGRLLVAVIVVATLIGGATYAALDTGVLAVRTVRVSGNHQESTRRILDAARVPVGTPMVRLEQGAIRQRVLASLPGVDSVEVVRSWPSEVRLVVRERVAAAAVARAGRFVLLDPSGVQFRSLAAPPAGIPLIDVGDPRPADPATQAALAILRGLPSDLRALLAQIAAPSAEQVTLRLRGGRDVLWGDAGGGREKAAVLRVLLRRPGRHIDVSSPGLVTIR